MSYKRTLITAGAALLTLLLVSLGIWAVWKLPQLMIADWAMQLKPDELLERENSARVTIIQAIATLAQIVGGLILLVGLYYTWRNVRVVETNLRLTQRNMVKTQRIAEKNLAATQEKIRSDQETAAKNLQLTQEDMKANQEIALKNLETTQNTAAKNLQIAQETLSASLRQQITDRFMRAVEQLSNPQRQAKLAGIYTLERIAQESEQDHWPIMEIFTAYIRMNSPRRQDAPVEGSPRNPFFDEVQAICNVLRRRAVRYEREGQIIDLHGTDLREMNLDGVVLKNANLSRADLSFANLAKATLENADFSFVKMECTNLREVTATNADFAHAFLYSAILSSADLTAVTFQYADLVSADLDHANLKAAVCGRAKFGSAKLRYANLQQAGFQGADLVDAKLYGAHLEKANLTEANLGAASLKEAHLEGANLARAELVNADLTDAHLGDASLSLAQLTLTILHGVDLTETNGLKWNQIKYAHMDERTLLPAQVIEERNKTEEK